MSIRPRMNSSTNTILQSMAACDLLTVILPGPWYIYNYTMGGHMGFKWSPTLCFLFEFFLETTPQLFHNASIWLTLSLAIQRYCDVCKAGMFFTTARSRMMVIMVMCIAFVHMLPRVLDRVYSIETLGKGYDQRTNQIPIIFSNFEP